MKIKADDIGVDAGMIIVCDMDYFKGLCEEKGSFNLGKVFEVPNGDYRVFWGIDDTWNGDITGRGELEVKSGKVVVIDPCYVIDDDKWSEWLDKTDYGRNIEDPRAFIIDEMGGDGGYNVDLQFTKE